MLKRMTKGDKIFIVLNYTVLFIFTLIIILPIFCVVMNSFVSEAEIARRGAFILIPEQWDLTSYRTLWSSRQNLIRAYGNTLFRVIVGTVMNLIFTIALAYPLSKRDLKGRTFFNALVFFTMIFSGGMVPTYMVVKATGLIDSPWALIVPSLIGTWNMFMMRNFFYAIPDSLIESAQLDGANNLQILTRIVLPCSMASIATILLFYAVGHWNAWFDAVLYITDNKLLPMQNLLRNIIAASNMSDLDAAAMLTADYVRPPAESIKSATIVITTLPILVVYPFIQKYFVKGVMVGSVKG